MLSGSECLERIGAHVDPFTIVHPDEQYPIRAAVRYATEENHHVQMVYALLESYASNTSDSTVKLIGEIICQSHADYAECGLGSEACDELVSRALEAGFAGAKMTGGGAGGVVALLGHPKDQHAVHQIVMEYAAERGEVPHLFEGSSTGADASGIRLLRLPPLQDVR